MGSFFTNLQVKANEQNVDELISALVAAVQSQGFTFAQGSDSLPADREILLQPAENGWIAVYDEAAESQDSKILDKLAKVVSKELGTFVITTLVHDSDVLNLSLYHSGKVLNTYNSNPGYFGETVSEKNRTKLLGNETRWAPLLRPDVTKKHLRDIFDSKDLFAEHTLRKIAQAIGVDEGAISTGYRYLDRTQNAPKSLRFRRKDRPLYEQKSDGPPRFEPSLGVAEQTCVLSAEDVLHLSGSVENKGGAGAGLRFVIWGAAIEKNLIELTKLQVIIGNAAMREQSGNLTLQDLLQGKTPPPYWDDLTLRTIKSDQGAVLEAILPEKEFNAGMKHPMMTPGGDWQKHFEAVNETKIHVNLFGTVTKEGSGIFYLAIAPLQHKDTKGAAVLSYHVNVEPSLQKPLRFAVDQTQQMSTRHLLLPLQGNRIMFTLASFDRTRSEIVEKTKPVIDRMLTLLPGWKKATYSVFFRDSTRRPETIELSVKQVKSAARLADLYQAMIGENLVEATLTNVISFDPNLGPQPGMFGFGMGTSVLTDREAERSPTLAMWVDTSSIDHQTVDLIRELWRNLLDDLMSANGNQAVIARANYTPSAAHPTAYEVACGCHHTLVTARQWVQRWVRVPGNDTLYLCSSIYEQLQLAEKDTIAKIATVRTLESSITKITLINAEDARSLEQALAAVLPSAEQSREASRNWYTPKTESS